MCAFLCVGLHVSHSLSLSLSLCFHPRFLLFSVLHANVHQGRKTTKKERRRNSQRGSLAADWRPDRKGVGGLVNVEDATSKKQTNKENQTKTNPIRLSNPRRENQCGCLFYVTVLGKPHNPLINAGALVTTSLLLSLVRPESTIADKFEYIKDSYKVKTTPPRRPLHTTATDRQHHRSKLIGSEGNSRFPCATVRYFFSTSLIGCC